MAPGRLRAERSPSLLSPGCLVDRTGKILIPGISKAVAPVTEEELELYDKIDFDLEEYAKDVGTDTLLHSCKVLPGASDRCLGPGATCDLSVHQPS